MKKMNKKGFTLIELLAVIVILAIVAAVTMTVIVPMISGKDLEGAESSVGNMRQQIVSACSGMGVEGIPNVDGMYGEFNGTVTESGPNTDDDTVELDKSHCLTSTCSISFTAQQLAAMNISGELPVSATIDFNKCQITSGTFTYSTDTGQFKGIKVEIKTDGSIEATKSN